MTTPHPQADLLRAIADGKQMQELDFPGINHPGNWCDCDADRALNLISRGVEQYVRIKPDPWFVERFWMNYADTANKIIKHRNEELAAVFDSVTLERTERSSLNDIGGRAKALAQAVRRKINEAA